MTFIQKTVSVAKWIINTLDTFVLSMWGLTIIDLATIYQIDMLNNVDSTIKTVMAVIGGVYLLVQLPYKIANLSHRKKMNSIERQIREAELKKMTKKQK